MEYILFDDCYMSTVEVAYDLKNVTSHLIASTSEIMAYGMPYDKIGQYLIENIDYKRFVMVSILFIQIMSLPAEQSVSQIARK